MAARIGRGLVALVILLALVVAPSTRGWVAFAVNEAPDIGPVTTVALDSSGNGWAWATAAPQKPATRYLLRIKDGAWDVAADSTTDPELLPFGVVMTRLALTADGNDGWAIGNVDGSTPLFWRYTGSEWKTVTIPLPDGATQPHSLTISADGSAGWMTVSAPGTQSYALLTLRNGAWASVPQPNGGHVELAAVSPDGKSGWALGSPPMHERR